MSKRKPLVVENVLPSDTNLGKRANVWKDMMDKYSKMEDNEGANLVETIDALDYVPSDDSDAEDVESNSANDSEPENQDEIDKQLRLILPKREESWQQSGLVKIMQSIEDESARFNILSREKVESWLRGHGMNRGRCEVTEGRETLLKKQNEDGDQLRFHRKQELKMSTNDDTDSLLSVDTAKYILSNKKNKSSFSKVKVTTMIKQYTIATNSSSPLHSRLNISSFPTIQEGPSTGRAVPKSDSALNLMAKKPDIVDLQQELQTIFAPHSTNRRKVFKKTKKKTGSQRSLLRDNMSTAAVLEKALQSCCKVSKVAPEKTKRKQVTWKEESPLKSRNRTLSSSSSEEESGDNVFHKQRTPPKKVLRRKPLRRMSNSSNSTVSSPPKQAHSPPPKLNQVYVALDRTIVDKLSAPATPTKNRTIDLVEPFREFSLDSPKPTPSVSSISGNGTDAANTTDVLLTGISSANTTQSSINDTKKTENNTTSSTVNTTTTTTTSSKAKGQGIFRDPARKVVIYAPKEINPDLPKDAIVYIRSEDLDRTKITKPRHIERFRTFNKKIHPNSSIVFYPSDSEEDIMEKQRPSPSDSDSYDSEDPILYYDPEIARRLNVCECTYVPPKKK